MISHIVSGALAFACFGGTAIIAIYVSTRLPPAIDRAGMHLHGFATPLAALFTLLGRWYAILGIAAAAVAIASSIGRPILPVLVLFGCQVAAQLAVAVIKAIVRRARPARWLLQLETDSSFPSGHATTSVVFFIGLIPVVASWNLGTAATSAVALILVACAGGVAWSRLALGAHYVTDVAGGILFGTGWLLSVLTILSTTGILPTG